MAGYDPNQHPQGQQGQPQQYAQQPQQQQYYDPNDPNQQYYGEEGEFNEDDAYYSDEEGAAAKSLPWMAIALVGHALALFIATFIITAVFERAEIPPNAVSKSVPDQTPDIEPETPEDPEVPEEQEVHEEATEVEQVEENTENQDVSEVVSPVDNPNPNPTDADSPSPNSGPNSNNGLGAGGGGGGGGPRGGGGGLGGRSGIRAKPQADRTNAALQWLADHQNRRGFWSPDKYLRDSIRIKKWKAAITNNVDYDDYVGKKEDKGLSHFTVGLSALALLAFVGDGNTHESGDFKSTVKRAAQYLMGVQDAEGCFGKREHDDYVYNHAICAMAFCELFAMTGTQLYKKPAQLSVDFIVKCQNPGLGWRYGIQPKENDSSVTAWMVLALKSAKIADLKFNAKEVYEGANNWYDKVEGKDDKGYLVTGYNTPASGNARPGYREDWEQNAAMDACNAMVRLFTGKYKPGSRDVTTLAERMMADKPAWMVKGEDGKMNALKIDYYYWYYGSLAAFQIGGNTWSKWEKSLMQPILLKYQRGWHEKDKKFGSDITKGAKTKGTQGRHLLDEHGSWDCLDPWCVHGGRVYSTAINALTLEVYYRYERVK